MLFLKTHLKKSLKTHSSPGPSGQNASLFRFLFNIIPQTVLGAFNQIRNSPELEDSAEYSWVKNRTIVRIKKRGRSPTEPSSYRPISLLEVFYKILSKMFINRINPSTTIYNILNKINHNMIPAQMISLDVRAAFDTAKPHIINSLLAILFPASQDFLYQLHRWTARGTATIRANGEEGELLHLRSGTGQGDPSSSTRFLILQHLQSEFVRHFLTSVGASLFLPDLNAPVPPQLFADDTFLFTDFNTADQIEEFADALNFVGDITSLHVNRDKTKIISLFPAEDDIHNVLSPLGTVTDRFTHLGIVWGADVETSARFTYETAYDKLRSAVPRITNLTSTNTYHRSMLLKAILLRYIITFIASSFKQAEIARK